MQGSRFVEGDRWALNRMFRFMTAWGLPWDIMWEVAVEQAPEDTVQSAMEELERSTTRREQVSINSALRKEGFDQRMQYDTNTNYYEVTE